MYGSPLFHMSFENVNFLAISRKCQYNEECLECNYVCDLVSMEN